MKVLVTGANGFVGNGLIRRLGADGLTQVRAAVRVAERLRSGEVERVEVGDISARTDWGAALDGVDVVVHLAARAHVLRERSHDPAAEFRRVNVDAAMRLAVQAAQHGVRRFVFLSSVKVHGEAGAFSELDACAPTDPYGVTKLEAERALFALGSEMEIVIVRPPLVYGPGVGANFASLVRAVSRGVPLPLGAINNRRSFLALDNLTDFIVVCLRHPAVANQVFLISDGEDLSTTELILRIGVAVGRPARLIAVPATILRAAAMIVGRPGIARRLLDSLQIVSAKARGLTGWVPPVAVDDALRRAAVGGNR